MRWICKKDAWKKQLKCKPTFSQMVVKNGDEPMVSKNKNITSNKSKAQT